jgi:hypothetical protein
MDEPETPAERPDGGGPTGPGSGSSVVLATFENGRAAERMVASLGRDFRHEARNGKRDSIHRHPSRRWFVQPRPIARGHRQRSRVGRDTFTASLMAGIMGSMSAVRGAEAATHSAHERRSQVHQTDQALTELLDQVGRHAAALLIVCQDEAIGQAVAASASDRARRSLHLSRADLLAVIDRSGDNYDWVRPAIAEPAPKPARRKPPRPAADS